MTDQERVNRAGFTLSLDDGQVILTAVMDDGKEYGLVLGPKEDACEEMCRFLSEVDYGHCG